MKTLRSFGLPLSCLDLKTIKEKVGLGIQTTFRHVTQLAVTHGFEPPKEVNLSNFRDENLRFLWPPLK